MPHALTPSQQTLARSHAEAWLEEQVRVACRDLGLRYYHTHRSQHSPSGFPDDVIVGPTRMVYRELKRESGKPTDEQQAWLDALAAVGQDTGVWRPSDWYSGLIPETLADLRARR